jgi:hypothetical protein
MYDKRSSMTAKQARRLLFALATVLLCVALAQQQAKPNRTVSYFTKNDPKYGEVISALGDEPKCATVDVNVDDDSASWLPSGGRSTKIDPTHETWWLTASPKEYSSYKKYRYNYVLEPPGTLTLKDMVVIISDKTARGLAERVCSQVTGTLRGARIHVK